MDKKTIEQIKNNLLERKQKIIKELALVSDKGDKEYTVKFPEYGDKPDENAQEIGEYTTNVATEKVLESTLKDIDNALKRIDSGAYGVCKYCEKEIGEKRMLARPVASACVACKEKLQSQP